MKVILSMFSILGISIGLAHGQPLDQLSIEQIALMTKQSAVEKLERLLDERKLEKNRKGEGTLWVRLAEEKQQIAAIEYKIAQDKAEKSGKSVTDERYRQQIGATLPFLNQAILRDPSSAGTARAYFLRGKAYREMGKTAEAIQDFQKYLTMEPNAPEASLVNFALADLHYSTHNYPAAIRFLSNIKLNTNFKHYAEALNIFAWSYFNQGQFEKAIDASKREIQFYQGRLKKGSKLYLGGLQRASIDYAQFFVAGMDKKLPGYTVQNAYQEFSQLSDDKVLQEVSLQFVKSIKVKMWHEKLDEFKEVALQTQPSKPSTFEILMATLDHQILYQRVEAFEHSLDQAVTSLESYQGDSQSAYKARIVQVLSNSVDTFTQYVQKNAGHQLEGRFRHGLNQIYATLLKLLPASDPRVAVLHFNMGENAFAGRNYAVASKEFRIAMESTELRKAATLKSVSARYEELRLTSDWPRKVELRSEDSPSSSAPISQPMQEWLEWVDQGISSGERARPWDTFAYEAARIRYVTGSLESGVEQLKQFVTQFPGSTHSPAAQTLVLDTFVRQKNWEAVKQTTAQFKELKKGAVPLPEDKILSQRFKQIEQDAQFKDVERAFDSGQSNLVFQQADQAMSVDSAKTLDVRRWDILALGLASAVKFNDSDRSLKYSNALLAAPRDHAAREQALRVRAELFDRRLEIPAAVEAYSALLDAGKGSDEVRKRVMELSWMSGDAVFLRKTLLNPKVCPDSEDKTCDQYRAILRLVDPEQRKSAEAHQYALMKVKRKQNRWLWAAVAWNGFQKFAAEDQNLIERALSEDFDEVDQRIRLSLIHWIEPGFAIRISEIQRRTLASSPIVSGNFLKSLEKRMKSLETLDSAFSKIKSFQWAPTRLDLMMSMFEVYKTSAADVAQVQAPAGTTPEQATEFNQVIQQVRDQFAKQADQWKERIQETIADSWIDFSRSTRLGALLGVSPLPAELSLEKRIGLASFKNHTLDVESQRWVLMATAALEKNNFPLAFESIQRFANGQDESRAHFAKAVLFSRVGAVGDATRELQKIQSKDRLGVEAITAVLRQSLLTHQPELIKSTFESGKELIASPAKSYFALDEVKVWEYAAQLTGATLPQRTPGSTRIRRSK